MLLVLMPVRLMFIVLFVCYILEMVGLVNPGVFWLAGRRD